MSDVQVASPQAETPEPAGLDAILDSAIEQHSEPVEAAAVPAKETTDTKIDATGRAHAVDGKFVSTKPAEAEPSVPEPANAEAKPADPVAVDPVKAQSIEPHPRWSAELKAEFTKWQPEVQKAFKDRYGETEADYTRKTQELAETRKGIEPLIGEVQKWNPLFQHVGMTPHQFLAESAQVATRLLSGTPQERAGAIVYLANHHRIPPEAVLQAMGVPTPQAGADGSMTVDPTVVQLRQQLSGLETRLQQMGQQEQLRQRQSAEAEFNALGQAKDEKGSAKFPHFERVKQTMIQLVADGLAPTWDEAYSKSIRLDDELHKQVVEQERTRALAEAEAARQAAVEKAKKTVSVKTSSGTPGGGTQVKGLDAHLGAAIERSMPGN